ncbi:4-(cytidine 5'-diphospho)-2-C-methyl-D-erythritol kinase [Mariniblastus fucicola]|uniref:4-diphosphocytidyl-2-C-methyl-D-erythritol kinase n=1 Tax=Mariniblastus fucicola TaxID=980251 RepID=A0A5B9PDU1_9BACT|nr:4-(cytidine 5'-diphospho)-2-C-methyl-D-erythritol kinase [Mariniblastus fucicola]QEG21201.1 4-diphosphocytidyl-2-C-methyl-D-erythritol kinase [Mariniblastus fucicola]
MKIRHLGQDGRSIRIATPAKLNLFFELLGKRGDGFHEVETVMSTVSLFDDLQFSARDDGLLRLSIFQEGCTATESIPDDDRNLILKSMSRLRDRHGSKDLGCDVFLRKRIPSAAGLGGASGNAAGALLAANWIWKLGLTPEQLDSAAAEIGSDVPFFFHGGSCLCTGRGEVIESKNVPSGMAIVIAKPDTGLSTAAVYGKCSVPHQPKNSDAVLRELQMGRWNRVGENLFNRLEEFAMSMTPAIGKLKDTFDRLDCVGHQMSGSGSSYFGIFRNAADAHRAAKIATLETGSTIFACSTLGQEGTFRALVETG